MARPSSIDLLPPEVREPLHAWLRDPSITQLEATERANAVIGEINAARTDEPPIPRVTKSSVNRYAVRMNEAGEKLRQSRVVAEMWIGKLGAAPQGQVGHLVNEMLRTLAFELTLKLQDTELDAESLPEVIEQLKQLSLSAVRLERAASENVKRDAEIRKQAAQEAATAAEKTMTSQGMSRESIDTIKREILGIA